MSETGRNERGRFAAKHTDDDLRDLGIDPERNTSDSLGDSETFEHSS